MSGFLHHAGFGGFLRAGNEMKIVRSEYAAKKLIPSLSDVNDESDFRGCFV